MKGCNYLRISEEVCGQTLKICLNYGQSDEGICR